MPLVTHNPPTITSLTQLDKNAKRIVSADLILEDFDTDETDTEYNFHVSFYPLTWMGLIIAFAYEAAIFLVRYIGIHAPSPSVLLITPQPATTPLPHSRFLLRHTHTHGRLTHPPTVTPSHQVLFAMIGLASVLLSAALYLLMRATTLLETPPQLRIAGMWVLIAPPPTAGIMLGLLPIVILLGLSYAFLKGYQPNPLEENDNAPQFWSDIDKIKLEFQDPVWNPDDMEKGRIGRMGVAFCTISFMAIFIATQMFLPRRDSKKEKALELKREGPAALKTDIWTPLAWKRSNFIFSTYMTATFSILIIEFSFWDGFGEYIWFVIIGFNVVNIFVGYLIDLQTCEMLLANPVNTGLGLVQGIVTLSADDFMDFLLGYFVEFGTMRCWSPSPLPSPSPSSPSPSASASASPSPTASTPPSPSPAPSPSSLGMMMLMRIYFDPGLEDFIGWVGDTSTALISMAKRKLPKWLIGSAAETAADEDEEAKKAEAEAEGDGGGGSADTVEPLLGSFGSYSCDLVSMYLTPFVTVLLMFYSKETHLPGLYVGKTLGRRWTPPPPPSPSPTRAADRTVHHNRPPLPPTTHRPPPTTHHPPLTTHPSSPPGTASRTRTCVTTSTSRS